MLPSPDSPGINVLAPFGQHSSIRQSALGIVAALRAAGVRTECSNVPVGRNPATVLRALHPEVHDVTLLHLQPDLYYDLCYAKSGLQPRPGVRRIGMWYFETEQVPADCSAHAFRLDEFWAPTNYIAAAMKSCDAWRALPVYRFLPAVELPSFIRRPRALLGIPEQNFVFLFMFDFVSGIERKNPLGLIQAFARAFRRDEPVSLVLKTVNGAIHPREYDTVRIAAGEVGAIVIDRFTSREETLAMLAACDAYVSLHRAEGLGLTMVEAMLLGKPTIATGYSGNLDFMTKDNSLLVDWQPAPVRGYRPPFEPGQRWAAPSVQHAANRMRWVFEHSDQANCIGLRGQSDLQFTFSRQTTGKAMAQRLAEIRAEPNKLRRESPFASRMPAAWNSLLGSWAHRFSRILRHQGARHASRRICYEFQRRLPVFRRPTAYLDHLTDN